MWVCLSHLAWPIPAWHLSTTVFNQAPLFQSHHATKRATDSTRAPWLRTTTSLGSVPMAHPLWKGHALRSLLMARCLRKRWRRVGPWALWLSESISWPWPCPVLMGTVTQAVWVQQVAATLRLHMSLVSTTMKIHPRTHRGNRPVSRPKAHPFLCCLAPLMGMPLVHPLVTPLPPPPTMTSEVMASGSIASTAPLMGTHQASRPTTRPGLRLRVHQGLKKTGWEPLTSTPIQPSWQPSTPSVQTAYPISGMVFPTRAGRPA